MPPPLPAPGTHGEPVVYFVSCVNRTLAEGSDGRDSLAASTVSLFAKAGWRAVYPPNLNTLCCGQPFHSKGLFDTATAKARELAEALADASEGGRLPILFDASPCTLRMRQYLAAQPDAALPIQDFGEFAHDHLLARLKLQPRAEPVALHVNCSARRLGEADKLLALAQACSRHVIVPPEVKCCGFGGDRGFAVPELNDHALRDLQLPESCREGYSSNRTCELGLSDHSGIPYRSIAYLLDGCAK